MEDNPRTNNMDWKQTLRTAFIVGMTGTPQEQEQALVDVGYSYLCLAPISLYKYYSDQPERLETIKNNKMWYSAPCNFNDPFDSDLATNENALFQSALQMIPDKREIRPGSLMWKQLKAQLHGQFRSLQGDFTDLRTRMGIACLSEEDDSLLMWAHYANNHRGLCVEYELMGINRELGFTPVPVIYSENRACFRSLDQETLERDVQAVFIESITSKSPEWCYEKEWRIIRDNASCGDQWDTDKKGALLPMIRPTSVALGCEASAEFKKSVREYCEANRITLYQMEKDKMQYHLNKKTVLDFSDEAES